MKDSPSPSEDDRPSVMNPRPPARLSALAATLVAICPAVPRAAERGCPTVAVASDAAFRDRFPDLLEHVRRDLLARPDIDACARIELRVTDTAIGVSVTLPDGRNAARSVARGEDVVPTLQALLLVPEPAPDAVARPTPPAPAAVRPPPRASRVRHQLQPLDGDLPTPSTPLAQSARELGFELSLISGARLGDGQFGYGAGMLSFLQVRRWLFGFEGRADGYRAIDGGDPQTALELAILAGRRLDFGAVALDLTAGPGVAIKGVAFSQTESVAAAMPGTAPPPPPPRRAEASSGPVPRLLLGARLGFSPRSVFRTFIGLDGELGPTHAEVSPDPNISSPRMPTFTVGLALGATVGTP